MPYHINIVLHEPEIPQNTGNIARTCAALGASLHLIEPLGFKLDDAHLKRAGLDYWDKLDIHYYVNIDDFYKRNPEALVYYFSKKSKHRYDQINYPNNVFLMFGKESVGLPEQLLVDHEDYCLRMPMRDGLRSLNLSNTVAIAAYEAYKQHDFDGLVEEGKLNELHWKE